MMTVLTCLTHAVLAWVPTASIRTHQWTPLQIASSYGLVLMVVMVLRPLGAVGGGWLSDMLRRRGLLDTPFWVGGGAAGSAVRALAAAIYHLVIGVVGILLGPLSVAILLSVLASALMFFTRPAVSPLLSRQ